MSKDEDDDASGALSHEESDYEVGNKRPPRHTQFELASLETPPAGQKGSIGLRQKIDKELRKSIVVTKNGKPVRMSKGDVVVEQYVGLAMKPDHRAVALVMRTNEENSAAQANATSFAVDASLPDKTTLKQIAARMKRLIEDEEE